MDKIRIQKALSEAGYCSRRKAEELIKQGLIKINGHVAEIGAAVNPKKDHVTVSGEKVNIVPPEKYSYLMMYKPRGYITTMSDEFDRKNVTQLLGDFSHRVYPIGRLDKISEGLLLFTNDGDFANMLMHPRYHISKKYRVTIDSIVTEQQLIRLTEGVVIDGRKTLPAVINVVSNESGRSVLEITIKEGRNRQIRKMCEAVGLNVGRLKRTMIGPVKLGMLAPGEVRELTPTELKALRGAITKAASQVETKKRGAKK